MSQPFIGEVRMFGFPFAPKGWAMCNGQLLSIQQNQALFAILGTTYGGNGVQTFQLPNLQGRVPVHRSSNGNVVQGQVFGEETHTLIQSEVPMHSHLPVASSDAASIAGPVNNLLANSTANPYASTFASPVTLNAGTVQPVGGSQPHENRQPYAVVNICIALVGVFPSRN